MNYSNYKMNDCILQYSREESKDGDYICIHGFVPGHECDNLIIPAEIDGLPVKRIGDHAFNDACIETVVFPNCLTIIDDCAFMGCESINSIVFPKNLLEINVGAFKSCYNLKNVQFNEGLEVISRHAFANTIIERLSFPNSLREIRDNAFSYCELFEVNLGLGLRIIGEGAFAYNEKIENINFYEGLERIEGFAFAGSGLVSVTLPDSLKYLNFDAFNSSAFLETLHIGANLENDDYTHTIAFDCPRLKSITVSEENENFKVINKCLYDMRTNELIRTPSDIKSLTIPKWVEAIAPDCFYDIFPDTIIIKPESLDYLSESFVENAGIIRCVSGSDVERFFKELDVACMPVQSSISNFLDNMSDEKDK